MMPKLVLVLMIVFGIALILSAQASTPLAEIDWSDRNHAFLVVLIAAIATILYQPLGFILTMWDYDLRIKAMDAAKVDVAIVSLTCPNCFFGDRATSLKAAQIVNDSMAEQARARPDRIRWLASIP